MTSERPASQNDKLIASRQKDEDCLGLGGVPWRPDVIKGLDVSVGQEVGGSGNPGTEETMLVLARMGHS